MPKALPQKPPLSCTPSRQVKIESVLLVIIYRSIKVRSVLLRFTDTKCGYKNWDNDNVACPPPRSLAKIKGLTSGRSVSRLASWFSRERCMPPNVLTWVWAPGLTWGQENNHSHLSSPLQMSARTCTHMRINLQHFQQVFLLCYYYLKAGEHFFF